MSTDLKNLFTLSATRYGLFEVMHDSPLVDVKGGNECMNLLTNEADSMKAESAARRVVAQEKALLERYGKKSLVLKVAKPHQNKPATQPTDIVNVAYQYTFTMPQLIARAKAIIAMRESKIDPEVLREGDAKATRRQAKQVGGLLG